MTEYKILPQNTYNMDEKGFLIRIIGSMQRIWAKELKKSGALLRAAQDGNREWLTILACICGDGTWINPVLIYQGVELQLRDTWL